MNKIEAEKMAEEIIFAKRTNEELRSWLLAPDAVVHAVTEILLQVQHDDREKLAQWMIAHTFSTGHGETIEDLLKELDGQIEDRIKFQVKKVQRETSEESARISEGLSIMADYEKSCCGDIPEMMLRKEIAKAIRQRFMENK